MSSSNIHPLVAENPLLPAQQLLHAATTSLWHVLIAALLGLIVARTLRSNHLHWSWAAVGLAPVVLVLHLLGESTLVVVAVALYATHRGRRWHQVDVDAGVDLAELAADRRTPLDAARSLARRLDARAADIGAGGRDGEGLVLGQDDRSRTVMIPAGGAEGGSSHARRGGNRLRQDRHPDMARNQGHRSGHGRGRGRPKGRRRHA